MADTHHEPNYMAVVIWLTLFTLIELGLGIYSSMDRKLYIALLIVLAAVKAILVAAYFMHLRFEKKTLAMIAIFPVILLVILTFALFPDSFSFITSVLK